MPSIDQSDKRSHSNSKFGAKLATLRYFVRTHSHICVLQLSSSHIWIYSHADCVASPWFRVLYWDLSISVCALLNVVQTLWSASKLLDLINLHRWINSTISGVHLVLPSLFYTGDSFSDPIRDQIDTYRSVRVTLYGHFSRSISFNKSVFCVPVVLQVICDVYHIRARQFASIVSCENWLLKAIIWHSTPSVVSVKLSTVAINIVICQYQLLGSLSSRLELPFMYVKRC